MKTKLFTLLVALITTTTLWAYDFQYGDLYYNITSKTTVEVTYLEEYPSMNYPGLTTATIPETVICNGTTYSVTSIGYWAFSSCTSLTSVTIPNSVTSIGDWAFYICSSLTSITIPESVTSIGISAFSGCSSLPIENNLRYADTYLVEAVDNTLSTYSIKKGTKWIGSNAFEGCSALTSITIPNSVTSIGDMAFYNCSSLTSITIPNSVTSIGVYAFDYCTSLTSITIPNSVTSIGGRAFENCSSLTSITIPNSVTSIGYGAFSGCSSLTSITIPNSVTSIGNEAFRSCSSLTSITIPNSVTEIESQAFCECEKLGTVILGEKIKEIGNYAFEKCNKLYHIYCYAPEPPMAYESSFANYNVNLYVPCNYLDNYKYDRVFGSFRYIQCIESEDITTNGVVITPSTNDVTITWPTEGNADTYTIVIKNGNEVFCTLTFNAEGQLRNISFASGRDGNHPVQYAEQASNGYRFTVTGLEEGTHYTYNIDVKNAANKTIKSYTGEFTTESMTAVENITTNNANIQKILRDGQLLILRDGVEYTIMGAEIQ